MSEEDKFQNLAQEYFSWVYQNYPVLATNLGIHRFDDRLTDFSHQAIKTRLSKTKDFLADFKKIKSLSLSLSSANDLLVLKNDLVWEILSEEKIKYWQKAPSIYSDETIWGLYFLINRSFAPRQRRAQNLLKRLRVAPEVLRDGQKNLVKPCLLWVEIAIDSVKGGIIFLESQVAQFARETKDLSLQKEILIANEKAIKAMKKYLVFLEKIKAKSGKEFALGRSLFEEKLRLVQMIDWPADELLKIGGDVFTKTEKKMAVLAKSLCPGSSWWGVIKELKKDHPAKRALLVSYRREVKNLKKFLKEKDIVDFPKEEKLTVMATPESEQATIPFAAYLPPAPFEKNQTGQFWVTPINCQKTSVQQESQLQEHASDHFPIAVIHESYPGHHLQLCFANQNSSFVRKHLHNTPYVEGWALYCEQLMVEAGYLKKPEQQLFQLKDQLWRAARVILDVSLHTKKMTFDQAVDFLVRKVHLERGSAIAEVKRYTLAPTYQLSYMMGKLQILALRAKVKIALGKKFSLIEFHRLFLNTGSIPVKLAGKEILTLAKQEQNS